VASAALFLAAAAWLGPLCLQLAPIVLVLVLGYSFTKRFHLACATCSSGWPSAARPRLPGLPCADGLDAPALWLSLAVATWIAGFDVLYALDDRAFDRKAGIHSIPARFGVPGVSGAFRCTSRGPASAALLAAGHAAGLGWIYLAGMAVVIAMLVWEHRHPAALRPVPLKRGVLQPQRLRLGPSTS